MPDDLLLTATFVAHLIPQASTGVIQLYDIFVETLDHRTVAYLELEYCSGDDLASLINSNSTSVCSTKSCSSSNVAPTAITLQSIVNIATSVCSALKQLHANGIVHRDIKPSNVLVTTVYSTGNSSSVTVDSVKLCDLGVSTILNNSVSDSNSNNGFTVNAAGTPFIWHQR
jgi:serine/threonine protein kinase